jgi:thiamine pyrophosphokinase
VRALVIANGTHRARGQLRRLARSAQLVIAADGGADIAAGGGVRPHLLVGDMDSITGATRARLARTGVKLRVVPREKDLTDTELALRVAREHGAREVVVAAPFGGRVDHVVAHIFLLFLARAMRIRMSLMDGYTEARLADGRTVLDGAVGDLVSLIPLSARVEGITTFGLRYPLARAGLRRGTTRGVSNVITELPAGLERVRAGDLLVVHTRRSPSRGSHGRA